MYTCKYIFLMQTVIDYTRNYVRANSKEFFRILNLKYPFCRQDRRIFFNFSFSPVLWHSWRLRDWQEYCQRLHLTQKKGKYWEEFGSYGDLGRQVLMRLSVLFFMVGLNHVLLQREERDNPGSIIKLRVFMVETAG